MNKRRFDTSKIFWGLIFLAGAVVLILSRLGYMPTVSLIGIFFTILFVWMLIRGILRFSFPQILFSLAFLACIYDEPLGITELTPWTVLGAALLGSIGLNLLFPKKHHWHVHREFTDRETANDNMDGEFHQVDDKTDGQTIYFRNTFGGSVKYINSENFVKANLENSFGELKVYLDNAMIRQKTAQIQARNTFGSTILYIPRTWMVKDNISATFGSVDVKNPDYCQYMEGNPVLYLVGEVSFGDIEIFFI